MPDRLSDLVEKAELAVASSSGVVDEESLQPLIDLLKTIRVRMSYPDDVLIVALAGGTGSGKSSLFNALAQEDLVDVGGIRPTTSEPAAAIPRSLGEGVDGFLDHLGIDDRHHHDGPPICLIDLPDTDSVEAEHQVRVDRVLPYVDAVAWVTDPEKYRDARLHHDYLGRLADHSARFVVVLNQIDRLVPSQALQIKSDLESALVEDGLSETPVVPIAAAPVAGPPLGLDVLTDTLEMMRQTRQVVSRKMLTDLGATAGTLAASAGTEVGWDDRATAAVDNAVTELERNEPARAADILTVFLDSIAREVGGPTGEALERNAADVPAHITRIVSEIRPSERPRTWFRRRGPGIDTELAKTKVNEAVIRPARALMAKRAVALASIADLAVEVESLRDGPGR